MADNMRGADEAERIIRNRRQEREKTADESLRSIRAILKGFDKEGWTGNTSSPIYDAVALAAASLGQKIIGFNRLNDTYGSDFTVEDIARLSHIPCRHVVFDDDIQKDLFGTYIVFDAETGDPCVLIQDRKGHLLYRRGETPKRMTASLAQGIGKKGYVLYEPLPENDIQGREVLLFFLRGCSGGDKKWLILFSMIATAIGILLPVIMRVFYDYLLPMGDISLMLQSLVLVLAGVLAGYVFTVAADVFLYRMMSRGEYRLKAALLDRVFRLPTEVYNRYDSSDMTARAVELPEMLRDTVIMIIKAVFGLVFGVFYIIMLFSINVSVAGVALVCLAVITFILLGLSIRQGKRAVRIKNQDAKSQAFLFQMIGGIGRLRISGSEQQALSAYMDAYAEPLRARMRSERIHGLVKILRLITTTFIFIILLLFAYRNTYSVGEYVSFTSLFSLLSGAVYFALDQVMNVFVQKPVFERGKVLLQALPDKSSSILVPKPFVGRVRVENLFFVYEGMEKPVLNGISFDITPGEYVGIVGASGCGKSTLMKLMLGFIKPDEGKIYYDGIDMDFLDKSELRRRMGVVLQGGSLFAGTVAENIRVTKPDATDDEVMEALDMVGMSEDIRQMPMGLQTILSEMSETISGGQRQRILIARAILAGPRVMFMDEATSALDNRSQSMVTEALAGLNMTRIVIAHRLTTIRGCDKIIVLEDGVITQQGTYEELMAQDGFFRKMAERQLVD